MSKAAIVAVGQSHEQPLLWVRVMSKAAIVVVGQSHEQPLLWVRVMSSHCCGSES